MTIYLPGGPAAQLANLSFFLAALVSDVLLIRFFLVSAYLWLLICESNSGDETEAVEQRAAVGS